MSTKDSNSQSESNIQTFLRIRPSKNPSGFFQCDELEKDVLLFTLPDNFKSDYINNSKLRHTFQFNRVLDMSVNQEQVFKTVGVAAVQNAIEGFNSTIFAYGQTGSGKTYTLTGSAEKYVDRGLIPRAISMLFKEFRTRSDAQFKVYISYLELYNEQGYDLLDPSHENKALEDLPKVSILEDENGNFHLKNLSMHSAENEEEALNLLFVGETNRAIAETPMNMTSSRSHCIFTLSIEARLVGSDKVRRSKLHLVDLAGSERVSKTNSSGSVLNEAKYINTSLFFLEMVIVALYEKATKGRSHVPYRNSIMTSVLRDSLGGNCKTIMIATINPEAAHTEESISTCRFAKRVSLIKNRASINEDMDPSMMIRRLKTEILSLREEICFLKGESGEGDVLNPQELDTLRNQCRTYCYDPDPNCTLNIGTITLTKIKDAFAIMKSFVLENSNGINRSKSMGDTSSRREGKNQDTDDNPDNSNLLKQIKDLKSSLLQRESEIAILVNMVKKGKTADDVMMKQNSSNHMNYNISQEEEMMLKAENTNKNNNFSKEKEDNRSKKLPFTQQNLQAKEKEERLIKRHLFGVPPPNDKAIFDDAAASFEWFRERCSLNSALNENKELLKQKMLEAKDLGERANRSRNTITYLKSSIESIRRERVMSRLHDGYKDDNDDNANSSSSGDYETQEEQTHRRAIEQEKVVYKESYEKLRVLKPEIEQIKKMLEKCRTNIQTQFDQWYNNLHSRTISLDGGNGANAATHSSNYSSFNNGDEENPSGYNSRNSNSTSISRPFSRSYDPTSETNPRSITSDREQSLKMKSADHLNNNGSSSDDVNEEILAFYQAKDELLKRRASGR